MQRRSILWTMFSSIGAASVLAATAKSAHATTVDKAKVAYHLSEQGRVAFVLGNIQNHFDGMGGPGNVKIVLVIHGPALQAFHAAQAHPEFVAQVAQLAKNGLEMNACINTMKAQGISLKDLLPGFGVADKGGVVMLAELQGQGYAYLRP
ncbi:dsrE/DsrF-like family protein [Collimonas arenae]|uniref:DsrE/DsrF-like family protein n=1 Tax=Collimonas arenae TaxID=279058 RepID=A0A127QE92_9BURK|nr:DsrE family protein [Collimonas arenae]AMO98442.1 dsrE/DsrF-like family protein [Collimonas arenae]AMP08326.1 dsrE/DsrF-like family protein [Collimonas arenae]